MMNLSGIGDLGFDFINGSGSRQPITPVGYVRNPHYYAGTDRPRYIKKKAISLMDSLKQHAAVYAPLEQITNAAPKPVSVGPLASKIKDNIPPTSIMPGAAAKPASKKALIGAGILAAIFLATKGMGA